MFSSFLTKTFYFVVNTFYNTFFASYSSKFIRLRYNYNGSEYFCLIEKKPSPLVVVTDITDQYNGTSVYEDVIRYLGPNQDFHGAKVTPKDLGFKDGLCFFVNGNVKLFLNKDVIDLYSEARPPVKN